MEFVKSLRQTKVVKYMFIALLGSLLLAISSKIKIPFYPVPMTMQTFVVLTVASPSFQPNAIPINKTTKVCMVIGTG